MTIFELTQYAKGAAERDWETASFLAALVFNCHVSKKGHAKSPADFNPLKIKERKKQRRSFSDFVRENAGKY